MTNVSSNLEEAEKRLNSMSVNDGKIPERL